MYSRTSQRRVNETLYQGLLTGISDRGRPADYTEAILGVSGGQMGFSGNPGENSETDEDVDGEFVGQFEPLAEAVDSY